MENFGMDDALQTRLTPILNALEGERQAIINRNYGIMAVSAGIIVGCGLIALNLENPFILGAAIILGFIIYFVFSNKGGTTWAAKYKLEVVSAIVKSFFGEQGVYEPLNGHTESEFNATDLFNQYPDSYSAEDLIKGKVDKTAIYFSEVYAQYKSETTDTDDDGRTTTKTTWHTLFNGILFTADFNKHFHGRTIVKQKGFWNFSSFGNIELENPEFNKQFAVYADNAIEARYILSPALMEKLLLLNKNWGGSLGFSFVRSQLTIAIPMQENFFDISIWAKKNADAKWQKDWQIIADLISVVHDLDLNTRIWTKE